MIDVRVDFDQATVRKLKHAVTVLPEKVFRRVTGSAASYAITPVAKDMKRDYPGIVGEHVKKKRKMLNRVKGVRVTVGPERKTILVPTASGKMVKKDPAAIGRWYEEGTAAHLISARFKGGGMKIGPVVIAGTVKHPGAAPHPVGKQAYLRHRRTVLYRMTDKLLRGIDKQVKKLAVGS